VFSQDNLQGIFLQNSDNFSVFSQDNLQGMFLFHQKTIIYKEYFCFLVKIKFTFKFGEFWSPDFCIRNHSYQYSPALSLSSKCCKALVSPRKKLFPAPRALGPGPGPRDQGGPPGRRRETVE
jgi:hypothetical protein